MNSNGIYPYLLAGLQEDSSPLAVANVAMVNNAYRRRAPANISFSQSGPDNNGKRNPAYQRLAQFQNILTQSSRYDGVAGHYQSLDSIPGKKINNLLQSLQESAPIQSPYSRDGSRYVATTINLLSDHSNNPNQHYTLHYYQDANEEIVVLQDNNVHKLQNGLALSPTRGVGDYLNRFQGMLGEYAPAVYQSGRFGSLLNTKMPVTLVVKRTAGENDYQAFNEVDSITREATLATMAERQRRFVRVREIQAKVDAELQATNEYIVNPSSRQESNANLIRKNMQQLGNFFPGLDQSFSVSNSANDRLAMHQQIAVYLRNKSHRYSTQGPSAILRAYENSDVDPGQYADYSALIKARAVGNDLGYPLRDGGHRYQYAHTQAPLQYANLDVVIASDSQIGLLSDSFQRQDSFVAGSISVIDAALKPVLTTGETILSQQTSERLQFSSMATPLGNVLTAMNGSVDATLLAKRASEKIGESSNYGNNRQFAGLFGSNASVTRAFLGLNVGSGQTSLVRASARTPLDYQVSVAASSLALIGNFAIQWNPGLA